MSGEGTEICDWLTARDITCVLLKYRVPGSGPWWDEEHRRRVYPKVQTALQDAQRALRLVRQHAAEWQVDPHKIGVIGFSAGGHLVAAVSTHFGQRTYGPVDAADRLSCRPDFAIAVYPGHLWTHEDDDPATRDQTDLKLRPDIIVRADTPPTFLLQAEDDQDGWRRTISRLLRRAAEGRCPDRNAPVCAGRPCLWPAAQQTADCAMAAAGGNVVADYWRAAADAVRFRRRLAGSRARK
jgi:acetyl esterase/lipase